MLRLRPYKNCDAKTIVTWCRDEISFRKWCADRWAHFPITATDMNAKYADCNGDCAEEDNFYPMTAFDESGVVGHFIMRFTDDTKKVLRLGFVIVDDSKRGMGCGKEMLALALKYAFELLMAERVTLGVFDNNPPACYCYKAAGFREVAADKPESCTFFGETWKILELEMTKRDYEARQNADGNSAFPLRIRPYIESKDYTYLEKWIDDEKIHAFWCANLIPYPLTKEKLRQFLEENAADWTDSAYVATERDGTPIGFFCYSVNADDNAGFLKLVIVDRAKRSRGYGTEMLRLALRYAFQMTGAAVVQLNVFEENTAAMRCYEKAGFVTEYVTTNAFPYRDERWSNCHMTIKKQEKG